MVHTEPRTPTRVPREGFAWYRHTTQRWVMRMGVADVEHPDEVIIVQGQRFEHVDPGENPEPGNPMMRIRTCPHCDVTYWEHLHSAAVTMEHLDAAHPGWDGADA